MKPKATDTTAVITPPPDQTDQSQLVEKLSAETQRLHESQAVASVGSWETDLSTFDVKWTAETYRIFEVSSSEFHPTHEKFLQMVHPDDRAIVAAAFDKSQKVTDTFFIEHRICLPGGGIKVVEERWRSFRDETGNIARVLGTCQDITLRRQNEEKLNQHQTMVRIAGRIAKLGGWRIDLPDNKLFWSDEIAIIHELPAGYTPSLEEAIGYYPPEYREQTAELVRLLTTEGTPFDFEHELLTAKGRRIWVRAIGEAKRNSSGQIVQVYGAFQDITESKRLEAQYLRAQRLESVGTLSSGIAHDLNNILAPIMLSVETLQRGAKDEKTIRMLKTLESCSQRAANLVKQLLSFAKGLDGPRIVVDLEVLIEELQNMMKEVFPKDIFFEISLASDLRKVVGDPSQLYQVILNLCVNARDAMSRGGKLTISAENINLDEIYAAMNPDCKSGSYALITVTDTGEGIAPAVMDKIFDPFFTTKELGKGTGLGLATVMGIVRSQGGFVKVYSEVGKGTKFEVYLSAESSELSSHEEKQASEGIPHGNGELILLVDDETAIREIAAKTLVDFGYRVLEATNGAEGVAVYLQHQKEIALVLTDVSMPIMDGTALITALKSVNSKVRVVVTSGLPMNGELAKAMDFGVKQFLLKPYNAEKLLRTINKELLG